jgi:hypothetical protein
MLQRPPPDKLDRRLLTPSEALADLAQRYNLRYKLNSFYSMINRGQSPEPTYIRGKPKFTIAAIDAWVANGGKR